MINYKILAAARKEKGVTWKFLEDTIGGYRGKFVEYSHNKTTLTNDEEFKIAKALDVSLEYLCGKSEQKNKPTANGEPVSDSAVELAKKLDQISDKGLEDIARYIELILEHEKSDKK